MKVAIIYTPTGGVFRETDIGQFNGHDLQSAIASWGVSSSNGEFHLRDQAWYMLLIEIEENDPQSFFIAITIDGRSVYTGESIASTSDISQHAGHMNLEGSQDKTFPVWEFFGQGGDFREPFQAQLGGSNRVFIEPGIIRVHLYEVNSAPSQLSGWRGGHTESLLSYEGSRLKKTSLRPGRLVVAQELLYQVVPMLR